MATLDEFQELANQQYMSDGFMENIGAGVDLGQALLWRGAAGIGESMGFADTSIVQDMIRMKEENMELVDSVAAVPMYVNDEFQWQGLADQVARGIGTVGVAAPAAAVGVLGAKPAFAAGAALSGVMNIGDIGLKAEQLDPEWQADLADVGIGMALGVPEALWGGRVAKALKPSFASKGRNIASQLGGSSLYSAGTEGMQDFATSLAAHRGSYWNEFDAADALGEAAQEALVGGILGLPFGAGEIAIREASQARAENAESKFKVNDDGTVQYDGYSGHTFADRNGKMKYPHLLNRYADKVFGSVPSKILSGPLGQNEKVQRLVANFETRRGDWTRMQNVKRVRDTETAIKARFMKSVAPFLELSKEQAKETAQSRRDGGNTALDDAQAKGYAGLANLWDSIAKKEAEKYGIEYEELNRGEYFTTMGILDFDSIKNDEAGFVMDYVRDQVAQGRDSKEEVDQHRRDARGYINAIKKQGFENFNVADDSFVEQLKNRKLELEGDGMDAKEVQETLNKEFRKSSKRRKSGKGAKTKKSNPMDIDRKLGAASEVFWEKWIKDDADMRVAVYNWIDATSQRLAHAAHFGADGEVFNEAILDILEEANSVDQPVGNDDIDAFNQMYRLSQNIPTQVIDTSTKLGQGLRTAQQGIQAGLNATMLPLTLLVSFAEIFTLLEQGGLGKVEALTTTGRLTAELVKQQWRGRKGAGTDMKRIKELLGDNGKLVDDLGMSMYELKNTAASRLATNDVGGKINTLQERFFNMTLTPQFTEALRITAGTVGERQFLRDLNRYTTLNRKLDRTPAELHEMGEIGSKFADIGLNVDNAAQWAEQGASRGNQFYREQWLPAIQNFIDDTVIRPTMVQKPAWMSDERYKLLGQLKSFGIVFTNLVMKGWYHKMVRDGTPVDQMEHVAKIGPYIAMIMATQAFMAGGREFLKTGDIEDWEDRDVLDHVIGSAVYMGNMGVGLDGMRASSFGVDPTTVLAGPAAGFANDIITGISEILKGNVSPEDVAAAVVGQAQAYPGIKLLTEEAF